jgi:hypothetical protein
MNGQTAALIAALIERLSETGFRGDCQIHFGPTGQPGAVHLHQIVTLPELARSVGITAVVCRCHSDGQRAAQCGGSRDD